METPTGPWKDLPGSNSQRIIISIVQTRTRFPPIQRKVSDDVSDPPDPGAPPPTDRRSRPPLQPSEPGGGVRSGSSTPRIAQSTGRLPTSWAGPRSIWPGSDALMPYSPSETTPGRLSFGNRRPTEIEIVALIWHIRCFVIDRVWSSTRCLIVPIPADSPESEVWGGDPTRRTRLRADSEFASRIPRRRLGAPPRTKAMRVMANEGIRSLKPNRL